MLSKRAQKTLIYDEEYIKLYSSYEAIRNAYDPEDNPDGVVNIGTAISELMDDVLVRRFKENNHYYQADSSQFRYYQFWGTNEFRRRLATLITTFFNPQELISYENIMVLNGALLSLDILTCILLDKEDVILCPTPAYNGYFQACVQRWNGVIGPIPMRRNEETGDQFELTMELIEAAYKEQVANGKTVKAFLFNNPHNPLGKVFSKPFVIDVMRFCQRNNLHLIVDEMYCMSVFDKGTTFHSVFELEGSSYLDKNRIHIIWGFSKDMCLTSFRTGLIHSHNDRVKMALKSMSQYQAVPLPVMKILEKFIADVEWIKDVFMPINHARMTQAYTLAKELFDSAGIETTTTYAGFFFLANLRPYLNPPNEETTKAILRKFADHKVYVVPYWEMKIAEAGWIRIVFTVSPRTFAEGFRRLNKALEEWKATEYSPPEVEC